MRRVYYDSDWFLLGSSDGQTVNGYVWRGALSKNPSVVSQSSNTPVTEKTQPKSTLTPQASLSLQEIIKKYRPLVAKIECEWRYSNGSISATGWGSGFFFPVIGNWVFTNAHVLLNKSKYEPEFCTVKLPDDPTTLTLFSKNSEIVALPNYEKDLGFLVIKNPTEYMTNLIKTDRQNPHYPCMSKPELGDAIIILGYPSIGSQNDITVTEGIISGYEGDFYITTAKIEHGNSGGAAILTKNGGCYLGIPTFAITGEVESLARILDFDAALSIIK